MSNYVTNEQRGLPKYKSKTRSESLKKYWQSTSAEERNIHLTEEQINKVIEKKLGYTWYNDGIKNYWIKPGQEIPDHYVRGMIFSEEKLNNIKQGTREYNIKRWEEYRNESC